MTELTVICYIHGYGSWKLVVSKGTCEANDRGYYIIRVIEGSLDDLQISNRVLRFPIKCTIVNEKI